MRSVLKVDIEDAQLYDVMLNTASAPLDTLAAVVIDLARAVEKNSSANSRIVLKDACIAAEVRAALMAQPKIGHAFLKVMSSTGAVTITGQSLVPPWDRLVRDVVAQVEGVTSVKLEADEPLILPRMG
jgi:osmotically-inducible protein OsmY